MTNLFTKQAYIAYLEKHIKDDEIIVFSPHRDITKSEVKKRSNEHRIEFSFAADCFIDKDSVSYIYNGERTGFASIVTKEPDLSEETKQYIIRK